MNSSIDRTEASVGRPLSMSGPSLSRFRFEFWRVSWFLVVHWVHLCVGHLESDRTRRSHQFDVG